MKKCLVVLGMHRSGTSAFTGILDLLGVNLGTRMLETQADNPKGFFENKYVVQANDCILETLQSGWDDILGLPVDWTNHFDHSQIHNDIRHFLHTDMVDGQLSALKDPRMSRLLPLWLPHFRAEDVSLHIALVIRNPLEIAESLQSRNGFSQQKSVLLWLQYMLDAELHSRNLPRGYVHFDALLSEPEDVVHRAFVSAELPPPAFSEEHAAELSSFLDRNMRHHAVSQEEMDRLCPPLVSRYYQLLCNIAQKGVADTADLAAIDAIREQFNTELALYYNDDIQQLNDESTARQAPAWYNTKLTHIRQSFERDKIYREYRYIANTDHLYRERNDHALLREHAERLESENQLLVTSPPFRVYHRYQNIVARLLPDGSLRRRALQRIKELILPDEQPKDSVDGATTHNATPASDSADVVTTVDTPLVFPSNDTPLVSIIIPVFNNWGFTDKCLLSVLEHTVGSYELIVVDNNSTDETPEQLAQITGIRVITNEQNEVFVNACNQAADICKGEFILLLNNDTEVTAGWLEAMLEPFDEPRTGIVGAKLIYPDGSLQEAGNIIWTDGTGYNYGHGDDPEWPRYCYRRAVDYCSGAALLIRSQLWHEVGGFDTRYAPAYYEDTDLCFTVRSLNYDVIYQPTAVVVHYGGASAGKDTSSGYKRFQEINRHKFVEKWQSVLDSKHFVDSQHSFLARERMGDKQILIIDHYVPTFDRDSGSQRMLSMLQILRGMGYKVTFWPDSMTYDKRYTGTLQALGIETWYGDTQFEDFIAESGAHLDAVLMSRPATAHKYLHLVKQHSEAQTIFDTVDLHFVREQRRLELEVQQWKNLEFNLAEETDATFVVSPIEKEILADEAFADKVCVVSNIHSLEPCKTGFEERSGLMFIGGFAHPPNEEGIIWFIEYVLPLVRKKIPGIHLTIVGSNPTDAVLGLQNENVTVTGYVEDVTNYFNDSRVFISPLLHGAGVKGKIGQSFSYGLPVVTTNIGAEGMYLVDGHNALISDSETEFADKIVELYNDRFLWQKISTNSRQVIIDQFSPETIRGALTQVLGRSKSPNDNGPRPVILHCHLFKNAGSTLDWSLARQFGSGFIDHRDDEHMQQGALYLGPYLEGNAQLNALSSHHLQFPLPQSESVQPLLVIALRHPIERARSVYEFERRQDASTAGALKAKELSFADYVQWRLQPEAAPTIRNFHCAWCTSNTEHEIGEQDYLDAVALLTRTAGIVIVERYDESMLLMEHSFEAHFPGIDLSYVRQNSTPGREGSLQERIEAIYTELGPELTHTFREANHWDVKLYEDATAILNERMGGIGGLEQRLNNFEARCRLAAIEPLSS